MKKKGHMLIGLGTGVVLGEIINGRNSFYMILLLAIGIMAKVITELYGQNK